MLYGHLQSISATPRSNSTMKKPEQHPSKIFWFLYCWLETNIRSLGKFPNWGNYSQEILKKNSWYSRKRSAMKSRCRKITNLNPVTSPSKVSVIDVRPRIFYFFFENHSVAYMWAVASEDFIHQIWKLSPEYLLISIISRSSEKTIT